MYLWAVYGTQTTITFPMVKRGVLDLAVSADWTPATGDTKISKDAASVVNTTNNPAVVAGTGSADWSLTLTAAELTCAVADIQIIDAATKAVEDQYLKVYTHSNAAAKIVFPLNQAAVRTTYGLVKNTAFPNFTFPMFDSADGRTPKAGLGTGVTGQVSKDGGAFGALANAVTELSNGFYKVDLAAADLNANLVILRFTATGADIYEVGIITQA